MYLPGYFTILITNFPIRVYIYSLSLSRGSLGAFWYETTISDVTITAREDVCLPFPFLRSWLSPFYFILFFSELCRFWFHLVWILVSPWVNSHLGWVILSALAFPSSFFLSLAVRLHFWRLFSVSFMYCYFWRENSISCVLGPRNLSFRHFYILTYYYYTVQ